LAGAMEEGHATAVGGARPVGGDPARGGQGAGADRVPARGVLGSRGDLHARQGRSQRRLRIPRQAGGGRRPAGGAGPRLLPRRGTPQSRPALPRRGSTRPRRGGTRRAVPPGPGRALAGAGAAATGHPRAGVVHGMPAPGLAERLTGVPFTVKSVERKPYRRSPYAPFRTTTLQQEASRKLGFSAKYTMSTAQR